MYRIISLVCAGIVSLCFINPAKNDTATDVLKRMYERYHTQWHKSVTFNQVTERYRNDSLLNTTTWYENMVYPDLLRIDIGKPNSPNGIIFRKDSTYQFRNNRIVRATRDENELIFFFGGMYFLPFERVLSHFNELHYDLSRFHEDTWKGKPVYVLGADKDGEKTNQLWIDKEKLVAVRFIKYDNNMKEEGIFENHVQVKNAWCETRCSFYFDDKLLQVETYHDIVADAPVDMKIFEPSFIGQ